MKHASITYFRNAAENGSHSGGPWMNSAESKSKDRLAVGPVGAQNRMGIEDFGVMLTAGRGTYWHKRCHYCPM